MDQGELERARELVRTVIRESLPPPPKLTLSQWAAKYGVLSKETSARTGRFKAYAYQVGIMDAISDPRPQYAEIVVKKSARCGFTRVLDYAIGYFIHQDPSPILAVQPRKEDADDYSKSEIVPMIRDIDVLSALMGDAKAKRSEQTILNKSFRNGARLKLVGANSPGGFRRITVRVVLFDEIDGFPPGAGDEGDQIKLGTKRAETFWNRKIVLGSTPTVKGASRIDQAYDETDQRKFYVPCPHCGEFQVLEWGGRDLPYGIKWKADAQGHHLSESAYYLCRPNACIIEPAEKARMVARGEWRATHPEKKKVGFHISALYSPHINAAWPALVGEWLDSKDDPLLRQTFVNLVLGEAYDDRGDKALAESRLAERVEVYAAEVPDGVAVITVGIDTQDDRVEIEVVGWGRNEESWSLAYEIIEGDPSDVDFWNREVDGYLKRLWSRGDGRRFEVAATCVDSGGHHTQKVYEFAKARLGRKVWAIKGESARRGARNPVWPIAKPSKRKKQGFKPVILGVNAAKDSVRARLHLGAPGPGFMHFPADRDINYFSQMVSERLVVQEVAGRKFRVWELPPGRANEALDARVYAYGALCGLMHLGFKLNRRADEVAVRNETPPAAPEKSMEEQVNMVYNPVSIEQAVPPPSGPARKSIARKLA